MKQVIVFGNDHTNTVGIVQALSEFFCSKIDTLLFGEITGYVRASNFTSRIFSACDASSCISLLLEQVDSFPKNTVIIPSCDSAAISLYQNKDDLLQKGFIVGGSRKNIDIVSLFNKNIQVQFAKDSGFNVPDSVIVRSANDLISNNNYPCLIKPLISAHGSKSQIRICRNKEELLEQYESIGGNSNVILQQYINRDYEISILGCALKDGKCIIPVVEDKLTLYPKLVGLECLAHVHKLSDDDIRNSISLLMRAIGYVGLFSVEMMHCVDDGKFYFTEVNLRNDGAQSFILKCGINLPAVHVLDLLDMPIPNYEEVHPGYYIWDMHHLKSLLSLDISIIQWLKEILKSNGFLMYNKRDKKPFYQQYIYMLKKLVSKKYIKYY